jgi:hypothetical protein
MTLCVCCERNEGTTGVNRLLGIMKNSTAPENASIDPFLFAFASPLVLLHEAALWLGLGSYEKYWLTISSKIEREDIFAVFSGLMAQLSIPAHPQRNNVPAAIVRTLYRMAARSRCSPLPRHISKNKPFHIMSVHYGGHCKGGRMQD